MLPIVLGVVANLLIIGSSFMIGFYHHRVKAAKRLDEIVDKRIENGEEISDPEFEDLLYVASGKRTPDFD